MAQVFNYRRFYQDMNTARKIRGITWNKVATRSGMGPSTLSMFIRQFEEPDNVGPKVLNVESLLKLMSWMNKTDLAPYIVDEDDIDSTN